MYIVCSRPHRLVNAVIQPTRSLVLSFGHFTVAIGSHFAVAIDL
jgi:hypothetical protein